ncbi:MAG: DUF2357 domain-containing protein [Paludibacter sp.]|nr:DUF2357 domain-containing protein [Paludibacter sp.]
MIQDNQLIINISVDNNEIILRVAGDEYSPVFEPADAPENGEAAFQIQEGGSYEYDITEGYRLEASEVVKPSRIHRHTGKILPNIFTGTLSLRVTDVNHQLVSIIKLEVRSRKTTYREDYRRMLGDITDKCTELLLQHNSPVTHMLQVDFGADSKVLYQRFAFIKSVLEAPDFADALHKILSSPVTNWKETESLKDIRNARRFDSRAVKQLAGSGNRIGLPDSHPLKSTLYSVPARIQVSSKTETADTPENRFIKFALNSFRSFISEFISKLKDENRIKREARQLEAFLDEFLSHSLFKEISHPATLPLNSPVLQRKEGYREVLRVWLMFDLAARLIWEGSDKIFQDEKYDGEKKDVAVLYEYWLYFRLLDLLKEQYNIHPLETDKLISETKDGLGLQLKQGKHTPLKGTYQGKNRKLHVEFSYNRTFRGRQEYPSGGSWSVDMRPDYTLSIWPDGISQQQAEKEELIVHIHFDAKYRIENLQTVFGENNETEMSDEELESELNTEKTEIIKGNVKRIDLLKMHAYKDAIRRTAGAYVLYPGSEKDSRRRFHEIIPGLGAFAIKPSGVGYDGSEELKRFLNEVTEHFMNRASEREQIGWKTYETYSSEQQIVSDIIPENSGEKRALLPTETTVLVGYYKSVEQLKWIDNSKRYNARTGDTRGSIRLSPKETGAKYLLLHGPGETKTGRLYKLGDKGPRIFSKADMIKRKYENPTHDFYLVYDIEGIAEEEFNNYQWDITQLPGYIAHRGSGLAFAVSMVELLGVKV